MQTADLNIILTDYQSLQYSKEDVLVLNTPGSQVTKNSILTDLVSTVDLVISSL